MARKNGRLTKRDATNVSLWIPREWRPIIGRALADDDTDQSKFIRAAIREKLTRQGLLSST